MSTQAVLFVDDEPGNLVLFPLSRYCLETPKRDGLVLGYGSLTPRQIAASTRTLAKVIDRARHR